MYVRGEEVLVQRLSTLGCSQEDIKNVCLCVVCDVVLKISSTNHLEDIYIYICVFYYSMCSLSKGSCDWSFYSTKPIIMLFILQGIHVDMMASWMFIL